MRVYGHLRQECTRTVDIVDDECECVVIEYFMAAAEAPTLAVKLLWLSNFCGCQTSAAAISLRFDPSQSCWHKV